VNCILKLHGSNLERYIGDHDCSLSWLFSVPLQGKCHATWSFYVTTASSHALKVIYSSIYVFGTYATSRKVAGSIPDEVIVFFGWPKSFQPHYGFGFDSDSNRNEYQETSWEVKGGWRVRPTTSPSSVSRWSRKCVSLDVLQQNGSPRPVREIALLFFFTKCVHILCWGCGVWVWTRLHLETHAAQWQCSRFYFFLLYFLIIIFPGNFFKVGAK
jgi:hypothetical protein